MAKRRSASLIIAVICALVGALILQVSMQQGPGIGGDATIYINCARNLIAGKGLGLIDPAGGFRLIPYFPPLYPLLLAFFGLTGYDIASVTAPLNLACFAILIFILSYWLLSLSRKLLPGLGLGLLLAASPILIPAYSWAMSEPLSILLGFGGLICCCEYLLKPGKGLFFASALLCGFSVLTRYGSVAFLAAGALVLLCFSRVPLFKRFIRALLYALIGSLPILTWLIYDVLATKSVASRSLVSGSFNELLSSFLSSITKVFSLWFLPDSWIDSGLFPASLQSVIFIIIIIFFLLYLIMTAYFWHKSATSKETRVAYLILTLSSFSLLYVLVILAVSLKTYPPITINTRMLLPVYIAFFCLIFALYDLWLSRSSARGLSVALSLVLFAFCAFSGLRGVRIARQNAIDGLGYNSVAWKSSDTLAWVSQNLSEDAVIVTNEETAILSLLGRPSWPMHEVYVSAPDTEFYSYVGGEVLAADYGRKAFQAGAATLVVFDSLEDQLMSIYGEDTMQRMDALFEGLTLVFDGDDGKVYRK